MKDIWSNEKLVATLTSGGVVVMPTDTIYGVVGIARNQDTVERIYKTRERKPTKPCIVLIGGMKDLAQFDVTLPSEQKEILSKYWTHENEKPTSVVLDCPSPSLEYLHRGTKTLAFRLPNEVGLRDLLQKTGPLLAPSANIEGGIPSKNIKEARNYFGDQVDLYIDGGEIEGKASRIIKLNQDGSLVILRE